MLRHSIREVAEELDEKLKTDTNTLISISTGDQAVQTLAAQINEQLAALRRERLRLQNGDAELKAAVTNMSHDLRTPLTAICGYLDLLEQCLAGFYGALTGRGITPEIQMPEQAVIRKLDAAATRRVLENILSNAVKYSDGDLCVSLTVQGKVTFTNHAANLGSVQVERLFDRFYTVETARHASGLGLSIAKLLTEQIGGRITANYYDGMLSASVSFP